MAEEARAMAGEMTTEDGQATMLYIAEQYEQLAQAAERAQPLLATTSWDWAAFSRFSQ